MLLYYAMFFNNNDAICCTQYWLLHNLDYKLMMNNNSTYMELTLMEQIKNNNGIFTQHTIRALPWYTIHFLFTFLRDINQRNICKYLL